MRVADWITEELIKIGVQRVYLLPGGFAQTLDDALGHSKLKTIWMLDEKSAGFAACADAQFTGQLGVCCVTAGPGSTNTLTAVASAWCDSLPLLVICGEINTVDLEVKNKYHLREGSAQDVNMWEVARPITKYVETAYAASTIKDVFRRTVIIAMEDRKGPTMIAIPLNIQGEEIE